MKKESRLGRIIERYRILRGFSKKRVDYSNVVKEFYIEDGLAYIACNVHNYNDVIDRYAVKGYGWPNQDLLRYIESNAYYIPSEYPIVLEICGMHFSPKQQKVIKDTLKDYYALKLGDTQLDTGNIFWKEVILFGFTILAGIALLVYWMLAGGDGLLQETLLIIFWFFLWEWGDVVAFERREVHMNHNDTAQLASMRIIFSDRFIDSPLDEDVKDEIIDDIIHRENPV